MSLVRPPRPLGLSCESPPSGMPVRGLWVTACRTDWHHVPGLMVDRPQGYRHWVFTLTLTPIRVQCGGALVQAQAGNCLIFPPDMPQRFGHSVSAWRTHWFHASGPALGTLVAWLQLPQGTPFALNDPAAIAREMRILHQEFQRQDANWELACAAQMERILILTARDRQRQGPGAAHDERLRLLRARIHESPAHPWPLEHLAHEAGMSLTRFRVRYRALFGISPGADVIAARIHMAAQLLAGNNTVTEAATRSGFNDLPYFHRQFKRVTGTTPGRLRPS